MNGLDDDLARSRGARRLFLAAALALFALLLLTAPHHVARRLAVPAGRDGLAYAATSAPVLRALSAPLAAGAALLSLGDPVRPVHAAALAAATHVVLAVPFHDWMIDDAGISFAYAENLARGHGLVLHPDHQPEEGYSNLLWVLLLALARTLGLDIALTAKVLGTALGALAAALAVHAASASAASALAALAIATAAPVVLWTTSGLENGLVCVLTIAAALGGPRTLATALGLLVLTRPEAPLWVAAVVAVEIARSGPRAAKLAVPALLALAAQQALRHVYFHAPFSNPYYAKGLSPLRIANVFGPGWSYVLDWLATTHLMIAVPLVLRAPARIRALVAAQLAFALMANGDWMRCGRFFTATHLLFAIAFRAPGRTVALLVGAALFLGTAASLLDFRHAPPTPLARITEVARAFQDLAHRLGARPRIAWHDAGGSSYAARLDVVDLGGLGNREIAQNRRDPAHLNRYLFDTARPTFFYSDDRAFAALWCGFHSTAEFRRDYVPLELPARLAAAAPICAVRRDAVKDVPGVRVVRDAAGNVERMIME